MTDNFQALAGLYAIGVVGAICVNLGSCALNRKLDARWYERALMAVTATILIGVELTLAKTKPDALFFVACVLIGGLALRTWAHRHSGMTTVTVPRTVAKLMEPAALELIRAPSIEAPRILVCLRSVTPVLAFAIEEARLRGGMLYVLYVREVAVLYTPAVKSKTGWQDDPHASSILTAAINAAREQGVVAFPVFATTHSAASLIVDTACTLGADFVLLGATRQGAVARWLKGNVVREVAENLPDSIRLLIHG